jgi:hypothetical protein
MLRVNYLPCAKIKYNDAKGVEADNDFLFDHLYMANRFISIGVKLHNPLVETSISHIYSEGVGEAEGRGHHIGI